MTSPQEKHDAFAAALEALAISPRAAFGFVGLARKGVYYKNPQFPAFGGAYFRMTEQEWDALWALIYG